MRATTSPKSARLTIAIIPIATAASTHRRGLYRKPRQPLSVNRTGAMTRLPRMSPSHHACHVERTAGPATSPPNHRLPTPSVALTSVLIRAARTIRPSASFTRSRAGLKSANRRSR
ncbi:MAG: hypothetical protein A3I06_13585 [Candidatus Lindowbacteria bacterium RIFCSPLOWO2_02_FULL_62_12]|nr:MAG: hypothetical protein A3I06_13585 [Candidatus Lindowbacteria bacterium RIFCSPLOWO2_02_FULL_62_12]